MDPMTMAALAAMIGGTGTQMYGALKKSPRMPTAPDIPGTDLPPVGSTLAAAEAMRKQGLGIFQRSVAPTAEMEAMGPILEAELARIRNQARLSKGSTAGEAERRGLTFSDIALGQIGGIDAATMLAELGARSDIFGQAMQVKGARESQELNYLINQISNLNQLAEARDRADRERYAYMGGTQAQLGTAEYLAGQQRLSDLASLGGQLAGMGYYGYQNRQGMTPISTSTPWNAANNSRWNAAVDARFGPVGGY